MNGRIGLKAAFLLVCFYMVAKSLVAQTVEDWENLKTAYAAYLKSPSVENLNRVDKLIVEIAEKDKRATPVPRSKSPNEISWYVSPSQKAAVETLDYMAAHFSDLTERVRNGDRAAIRLVYHLRPISGGGEFDENLDILLDSLIYSDPQLYLEELLNCRQWVGGQREIGDLVTFLGGTFADQPAQSEKEYNLRMLALQRVTKPDLKNIRNGCIEAIRNTLLEYR